MHFEDYAIPIKEQIITYQGRDLEDGKSLAESHIPDGATLELQY